MDPVNLNTFLVYFVLSLLPPDRFPPQGAPTTTVSPVQQQETKPVRVVSGQSEISFVNTTGNATTQTVGAAAVLEAKPAPWLIHSEARYVRTSGSERLQAENVAAKLRVARSVWDDVSAYGETRFVRNAFAGIRRQTTVEVGISRLFWPGSPKELRAEAAVGHINEDRLSGVDRRLSSGTIGIQYQLPIAKQGQWSQQAYLTADLAESSDWRLRHEASIAASLNAVLSLKFTHTLTYLHEPVAGFERADTIGSAALVAKF